MKFDYDIGIIGGGAAGLFAAICAVQENKNTRVCIFEHNERVGKKLLTTGNGRCNFSNVGGLENRYHGDADFAARAFKHFNVSETLALFKKIGVLHTVSENSKVFPLSLQAGAVVDGLRFFLDETSGVSIKTGCDVSIIEKTDSGFTVVSNDMRCSVKSVIVCTGGRAAPKSGSNGSGYKLLEKFGHTLTKTYPAIVQITTDTDFVKPLAGIKTDARVTVKAQGKEKSDFGELLFTDYGLSGPPVLQLSRIISEGSGGEITLDLLPSWNEDEIFNEILSRAAVFANRETSSLLVGFLNKRLGQTVMKYAGVGSLSQPISTLDTVQLQSIAHAIKNIKIHARGTKSWDAAQVTAGGISTRDFDPETMQSRLVKGLFAAGEVLNVDGDCGGFNLQWAWTSAFLAGKNAV